MNKNQLIIGGTGQLGESFLKRIVSFKDLQIVATYKSTKPKLINKYINWEHLDYKKNIDFDKFKDIKNLILFSWFNPGNNNSPHHFEEASLQYSMLEKFVSIGVRNISIIGTDREYGMKNGELNEEMECHPKTSYAKAKLSLLNNLINLKKKKYFNLNWFRVYCVYGGQFLYRGIWAELQKSIKLKKKYFKMSGGEQIRDYVHIDALIDHIIKISLNNRDNGIINICSGKGEKLRIIVNKWIIENEYKITPIYNALEYRNNEAFNTWGSITKLKKILKNK